MGFFENLFNHEKIAVAAALAEAGKVAQAEKVALIAEAKTQIAMLKTQLVADEPELRAAAVNALNAAIAILEQVAAAHGL